MRINLTIIEIAQNCGDDDWDTFAVSPRSGLQVDAKYLICVVHHQSEPGDNRTRIGFNRHNLTFDGAIVILIRLHSRYKSASSVVFKEIP